MSDKPTTGEQRLAQEAAESWAIHDNKPATGEQVLEDSNPKDRRRGYHPEISKRMKEMWAKRMSNQPKPIAGEWTADADGVLLPLHRFIGQYAKEIAEAHNATVKEAYEKGKQDGVREHYVGK